MYVCIYIYIYIARIGVRETVEARRMDGGGRQGRGAKMQGDLMHRRLQAAQAGCQG